MQTVTGVHKGQWRFNDTLAVTAGVSVAVLTVAFFVALMKEASQTVKSQDAYPLYGFIADGNATIAQSKHGPLVFTSHHQAKEMSGPVTFVEGQPQSVCFHCSPSEFCFAKLGQIDARPPKSRLLAFDAIPDLAAVTMIAGTDTKTVISRGVLHKELQTKTLWMTPCSGASIMPGFSGARVVLQGDIHQIVGIVNSWDPCKQALRLVHPETSPFDSVGSEIELAKKGYAFEQLKEVVTPNFFRRHIANDAKQAALKTEHRKKEGHKGRNSLFKCTKEVYEQLKKSDVVTVKTAWEIYENGTVKTGAATAQLKKNEQGKMSHCEFLVFS